jgi:1,4-alpha-glucan branching enzyme
MVERGMALHKLIRLMTITTGGEAYLNFMGNEFGHPEWIDFPREGNNWSYKHARRQWSLAENGFLRYSFLGEFDKAMVNIVKEYGVLGDGYPYNHMMDEQNKTMVYSHSGLLFVLNWHPEASIPDYELCVPWAGKYTMLLSSDEKRFGGTERAESGSSHFTTTHLREDGSEYYTINIYNTSRTAFVFKFEE